MFYRKQLSAAASRFKSLLKLSSYSILGKDIPQAVRVLERRAAADTVAAKPARAADTVEVESEASAFEEELGQTRETMRVQFTELYRGVRMLRDFSELSEEAFLRIAAYFDSLVPSGLQSAPSMRRFVETRIMSAYAFFNRREINGFIFEIEKTFARFFVKEGLGEAEVRAGAGGNTYGPNEVLPGAEAAADANQVSNSQYLSAVHSLSSAVAIVRPEELQHRKSVALLTFGIFVVLVVSFVVSILDAVREFNFAVLEAQLYDPAAVGTYDSPFSSFQRTALEALGAFCLYGWFFWLNVVAWNRVRINWPFIFDLNRRKSLISMEILSAVTILSVIVVAAAYLVIRVNTFAIWRDLEGYYASVVDYEYLFSYIEVFLFSLFPFGDHEEYTSDEMFYLAGDQLLAIIVLAYIVWCIWPAHAPCRRAPSAAPAAPTPSPTPPQAASRIVSPFESETDASLSAHDVPSMATRTHATLIFQERNKIAVAAQSKARLFFNRYRNWLRHEVFRIFSAPGVTVKFPDFFLADIFTSMGKPIAYIVITILNIQYVFSLSNCDLSTGLAPHIVKLVFGQWANIERLLQCLRRLSDERDKEKRMRSALAHQKLLRAIARGDRVHTLSESALGSDVSLLTLGSTVHDGSDAPRDTDSLTEAIPSLFDPSVSCQPGFFPHGANLLKYAVGIPAELMLTLYNISTDLPQYMGGFARVAGSQAWYWVAFAVKLVSYGYKFFWDVTQDWGLFKQVGWMSQKTYIDASGAIRMKWVRARERQKLFPRWVYPVEVLFNFAARFFWVPAMVRPELGTQLEGDLEIVVEELRRFTWSFFRVEHEHLCNCGFFKAIRIQPRAALEVS